MKVLGQTIDTKFWSFEPSTGWVPAAENHSTSFYTNGRHLFSKSYLVWL